MYLQFLDSFFAFNFLLTRLVLLYFLVLQISFGSFLQFFFTVGIVYLFIHYSVCAFCCCCCFTILSLIIIPALKSVSDNFNIWISLSLFSIDCPFSDFNSHFHISSNFGFYLVVILQTFRMIHMTVFPVCWLWGQMQPGQKRGFC